jgi:hypothetical protein
MSALNGAAVGVHYWHCALQAVFLKLHYLRVGLVSWRRWRVYVCLAILAVSHQLVRQAVFDYNITYGGIFRAYN